MQSARMFPKVFQMSERVHAETVITRMGIIILNKPITTIFKSGADTEECVRILIFPVLVYCCMPA